MAQPEPAKGRLVCLDSDALSFDLQFNPTTVQIGRSVEWAQLPTHGQSHPTLQFSNGGADTLQMEFLLDASENNMSVLPSVKALYTLTEPVHHPGQMQEIRPPCLAFRWEELSFQGVVQSMSVDFILFDEQGRPKRAKVKMALLGHAFGAGVSPASFFSQPTYPPTLSRALSSLGPRSGLLRGGF